MVRSPLVLPLLAAVVNCANLQSTQTPLKNEDPCKALEAHDYTQYPVDYVKPSVVNACLKTIPMNVDVAADALKGIETLLNAYSYDYYTINTGNPNLPIGVDLHKGLKEIGAKLKTYTALPDFTRDVQRLFISLHDGHTIPTMPCSDTHAFEAFLPLVNLAATADSTPEIYVTPLYDEFLADRKVADRSQFAIQRSLAGARVLEIDGQDAVQYLEKLIDSPDIEFGMIDPQTRWNRLLVNFRATPIPQLNGGYAFNQLARKYLEKDDFSIKVEFRDGLTKQVTIPFYGAVQTDYQLYKSGISFADYFLKYVCLPGDVSKLKNSETQSLAANPAAANIHKRDLGESTFVPGRTENPTFSELDRIEQMKAGPGSFQPESESKIGAQKIVRPTAEIVSPGDGSGYELITRMDSGVRVYHLAGTTLGVIQHVSFGNMTIPANSYISERERRLRFAIISLKRRGVKHIILEVSGNNGGYVLSAISSIMQMFPNERVPMAPVVYRANSVVEKTASVFAPEFYTSLARKGFKTMQDLLYGDGVQISVNSNDVKYSQPLIEKWFDPQIYPFLVNSTFPPSRPFEPENIVIVSSGFCISACSLFTNHIRETYGVKTVGFGGTRQNGKHLQYAGGMRGAQALNLFSVNYRTALDRDRLIPKEYVSKDVDYLYQHTNITFSSLGETWKFVASKHLPDALKTKPVSDKDYAEASWTHFRQSKDYFADVDAIAAKLKAHEIAPGRYPAFP